MAEQLKTFRSLNYRRQGVKRSSDAKIVKVRTEHNTLSTVKTLLTAFLVLLQLSLIVSLSFIPALGMGWYLIIPAVISILTAFSVLSSHRSTQSKAVWVLFILVFFCFGFLIYFMSNDKYMYFRARRRHKGIFKDSEQYVKPYTEPDCENGLRQTCRYLNNSGGFTACTGTDLQYFPSGASLFDDVLERLETAEKFVFIEYYAIADGVLWSRIWSVLERKIAEGVEVRIIYDDVGSRVFTRKTRKMMKAAGAQVRVFNRLLSRFTFAMNYRDHRKMFIIDGKTAYTGGSNIADEYINEKHMHGYWKDSGLRLDGEAVDNMTVFFLRQWEFIVREKFDYIPYLNHFERTENNSTVIPFVGGPEYELPICKTVFENVINSANERLYIMTPYFTPDESVMQALTNKALSGVDVRIILPSVPDKYYVYLLTRDNAEKLIKYGVKIYYMEDSFVHSKLVMNENCAVVGTVNFDMRSFYQQFENAVISDDKKLICDLQEDFERTFKDCEHHDKPQKNGLIKTVAIALLRFVAPLM